METLFELELSFAAMPEKWTDQFADYFWTKYSQRGEV